jgi:hypothetical protein
VTTRSQSRQDGAPEASSSEVTSGTTEKAFVQDIIMRYLDEPDNDEKVVGRAGSQPWQTMTLTRAELTLTQAELDEMNRRDVHTLLDGRQARDMHMHQSHQSMGSTTRAAVKTTRPAAAATAAALPPLKKKVQVVQVPMQPSKLFPNHHTTGLFASQCLHPPNTCWLCGLSVILTDDTRARALYRAVAPGGACGFMHHQHVLHERGACPERHTW